MLIFLFVSNKGVTIHVGRYWYGSMHGIECIGCFLVTFVNIVVGAVVVWRAVLLLLSCFCRFFFVVFSRNAIVVSGATHRTCSKIRLFCVGVFGRWARVLLAPVWKRRESERNILSGEKFWKIRHEICFCNSVGWSRVSCMCECGFLCVLVLCFVKR